MISTLKVRYVALFIPVLLISASVAGAQKPAAFDQQAVAAFYKDKNIRIVVGYPPRGRL